MSGSLPSGFDAAALVAAIPAGGVAACDAVRRCCSLSGMSLDEKRAAHGLCAAAQALIRAGAVASLREALFEAEQEAHQQLIKAALDALREVLSSFTIIAAGLAPVRDTFLQQLYASDGVALLLRILQRNPVRGVAFDVVRILRMIAALCGSVPPAMEACGNVEVLQSILYLGGAVMEPHTPCEGALWPLQFLNWVLQSNPGACRTLGSIPAFWPLLMAQFQTNDNACKRGGMFTGEELTNSTSHAAAHLAVLVLRHGTRSALPAGAWASPILAALCDNLSLAPADGAVSDAIVALVAARPETVAEALKFDLKVAKLRELNSLSGHAAVAAALRAMANPSDAAALLAALMPPQLRLAGVAPASPAQLAALDAAREKRERAAFRAAEMTSDAEDETEVLSAPLPLWRASQAASTGRERIALARANCMLRAWELRRRRSDDAIARCGTAAVCGCTAAILEVISSDFSGDPTKVYMFSLGLHHILGLPELVVLGDLPDVSSDLQRMMVGLIIQGTQIMLIEKVGADGDERVAAAKLCRAEFLLPDARCGIFLPRGRFRTQTPGLFQCNAAVQLPDALCREAGAAITWRFVTKTEALRRFGGRQWCGPGGAQSGRIHATFDGDNAGLIRPGVQLDIPFLVCSLAASFAAAPPRTAQKVLLALRTATQTVPRARILDADLMTGIMPDTAALLAEAKAQARGRADIDCPRVEDILSANLRSRMFCCALESCSASGAQLKKCSACLKAAYCCPEHQRLDWKRHKKECAALRDGK